MNTLLCKVDSNTLPCCLIQNIMHSEAFRKFLNYFSDTSYIKQKNISASTETMGLFVVTEESLPLYKSEISAPSLGVFIECLNDEGIQNIIFIKIHVLVSL